MIVRLMRGYKIEREGVISFQDMLFVFTRKSWSKFCKLKYKTPQIWLEYKDIGEFNLVLDCYSFKPLILEIWELDTVMASDTYLTYTLRDGTISLRSYWDGILLNPVLFLVNRFPPSLPRYRFGYGFSYKKTIIPLDIKTIQVNTVPRFIQKVNNWKQKCKVLFKPNISSILKNLILDKEEIEFYLKILPSLKVKKNDVEKIRQYVRDDRAISLVYAMSLVAKKSNPIDMVRLFNQVKSIIGGLVGSDIWVL